MQFFKRSSFLAFNVRPLRAGRLLWYDPAVSSSEVIACIRSQFQQLDRYGVDRIGVFGSCAAGTMREDSHIDVFVRFHESAKTFDNYMDLKFCLEGLFPG